MENLTSIDKKINSNTVLFFDMDGTLVDTDYANFLSYQEAIKSEIQEIPDIQFEPNDRFNRAKLNKIFPNLTDIVLDKIIKQKEINYIEFISHTKLIKSVSDILFRYANSNKTVLVTNCRKDRAILTLEYHKLKDLFSHIFFKQINDNGNRVNKYKNALHKLNLSAHNVFVFENENIEINDAILAGIPIDNILKFK